MTAKTNYYDRALARIVRIGAALGVIGTIVVLIRYGPKTAVGFLAGALLSLLNFYGLRRVAEALSRPQQIRHHAPECARARFSGCSGI